MRKQKFVGRFILPVLPVFLVMVIAYFLYMLSPRIPNFALYQIVADISGIFLFIALGFGALYVYPVAYRRGASAGERIVASILCPFLWATKEVFILTGVYTFFESLFFYLNPVVLFALSGAVAEMGLMELLTRARRKKAGEKIRAFSLPACFAIIIGLGYIISLFGWDLGVHHFYIFQEGYKALFGYGVGM